MWLICHSSIWRIALPGFAIQNFAIDISLFAVLSSVERRISASIPDSLPIHSRISVTPTFTSPDATTTFFHEQNGGGWWEQFQFHLEEFLAFPGMDSCEVFLNPQNTMLLRVEADGAAYYMSAPDDAAARQIYEEIDGNNSRRMQ